MALRITTHKGRTTKTGGAYSARHLDRHFNLKKAPHIDPARTHLNRYLEFDVDADGTLHYKKSNNLQAHELAVYEKLFKSRLDAVNTRYLAQRHKEKCKSVRQYYTSAQSCPDEYLIYIGDKDSNVDGNILQHAASILISMLQEKYSRNFIPLSIACHKDECGAAHIHFRCVWISTDKDGVKASISQGMKAAGIKLPDESAEAKRHNNRQMAFSEEIRSTFADICEQSFGLEIEREARDASKSGKDLATYQRDEALKEVATLENERSKIRAVAAQEARQKEALSQEVESLRKEKTALEAALSRLEGILLPIQKLLTKLATIRVNANRTALDEVLLDAEVAPSYSAIEALSGRT